MEPLTELMAHMHRYLFKFKFLYGSSPYGHVCDRVADRKNIVSLQLTLVLQTVILPRTLLQAVALVQLH